MGTGKQRISTAARLEAKAEGEPVLELELVQVAPEQGRGLVEAELERVPAAVAPVLVPVEVALGLVPVAAELELAQVAAELELAQVVVELAPGRVEVARRLGPVAVALRTKSVTAAHRPDLVPLLEAEEDLAAAVAETTREPAATEAVIAWAAEE
jgi:hypothetical protein